MVSYPDYEEYYEYEKKTPKIELNANARFLIAIAIVAILVAILAYSTGFQQGSATTSVVNNTKEAEQPTYIDRNLDETRYGYYSYYYVDDNYCPIRPSQTYRIDCP